MLESRIAYFKRKLQESRYHLYHMYCELAEPYRYMTFIATKDVWRISTNGKNVYFDPDWLKKLSQMELDFMMSHMLLHILLGHIDRPTYYHGDRYHISSDVVVNGKLNLYGWNFEKLPHIGRIRFNTYYPTKHGAELTAEEALRCMPVETNSMTPGKRRQMLIDSDQWWDRKDAGSECGVVVLSPLDKDPDDLTYEEYDFAGKYKYKVLIMSGGFGGGGNTEECEKKPTKQEKNSPPKTSQLLYKLRQEIKHYEQICNDQYAQRLWESVDLKMLDWKSLLHSFVQEEVNDYSFTPPDRRMQDMDFFLPDYNVFSESMKNVYFMVDTSGSFSDEELCIAFAEIKQALDQYNNNLSGVVVFFDTVIRGVHRFNSISDITGIKPVGGGGTDYECIFEFIKDLPSGTDPTSIVVITDGEGNYPEENESEKIPVLWLLTEQHPAPWGKSIYIDC